MKLEFSSWVLEFTWFSSSSFYFSPFATKIDFRPELEFDLISRNVFLSKQEETEGLTSHKWDTQSHGHTYMVALPHEGNFSCEE